MKNYILKRIVQMIPVLILVSIFSFMIIHFAPGDPLNMYIRPDMTEEEVENIRQSLGLDGTIVEQYFAWLFNLCKGNMGNSVINHQPVASQIMAKLPATLLLMGTSFVLSILVAIPLGLISGMKKNKWKKILSLFLAFYISMSAFPVLVAGKGDEPENLYALSAALIDGESGRVLYEKNGEEKRPMASTTKIMTCILTLESGCLEEIAEASEKAARMPKVHLGASVGEKFYVKDLLYSLMLESHNDSAVILAEHVGGSVEGFAEKMNEKAREIGCEDTWFITPNGLDAKEEREGEEKVHETTAENLAQIMRYCVCLSPAREEFLKITQTPSYRFSDADGKREFSCQNHNAFLSMMEGAISGKTGFTAQAGYCYVGALQRDGKTLIVALLGCGWPNNKGYKWSDTRKLMEYGLNEYSLHSFDEIEFSKCPKEIPVKNARNKELDKNSKISLVREKGEEKKILLKEGEEIEVSYHGKKKLTAPVKKGEKIGELRYKVDGEVWYTEDILTAEGKKKIDFPWCFEQVVKRYGNVEKN